MRFAQYGSTDWPAAPPNERRGRAWKCLRSHHTPL